MAQRRDTRMTLTPVGEPPEVTGYAWCPRHAQWVPNHGARLCNYCQTPVVRVPKPVKAKRGELRPGVVAEWED